MMNSTLIALSVELVPTQVVRFLLLKLPRVGAHAMFPWSHLQDE